MSSTIFFLFRIVIKETSNRISGNNISEIKMI